MRFLPPPSRVLLFAALSILPGSAAGQERLFDHLSAGHGTSERATRRSFGEPDWFFGEFTFGWFSSDPVGEAIDVRGETFDYDDVWRSGFGRRLQVRLHFGIVRGERTGLTVGPGLSYESGGYGTEGGTRPVDLRDGTRLSPESLALNRLLATGHGRYLFPYGLFVGIQVGLGLAFTNELSVGITDPGGTSTDEILIRRTVTIASDLSFRIGWRAARRYVGFGFYFEAGVGLVGAPRQGSYDGADPDPILLSCLGFSLLVEFGEVLPRVSGVSGTQY